MTTKRSISILLCMFLLINIVSIGSLQTYAADSDYLGQYDQSKNFGVANDFNVFVFGDLKQSNVDSEGRVAVGGNATLTSFAVGSRLTMSKTRADLIIGGDVDIAVANNKSGNTVISTKSNIIRYQMAHDNGVPNQPFRANVIDFEAIKNQLTDSSKYWGSYPANGTVKVVNGGRLVLEGKDSTLNVFSFNGNNIGGSGLSLNTVYEIEIIAPSASTVLINIGGDNIGFGNYAIFYNGSNATTAAGQYFVWNFYEATNLWNENLTIKGSILAPNAAWTANGYGNVEGNFIAYSLKDGLNGAHIETHNYLFQGILPPIGGTNTAPTVPDYYVTTNENEPVSGTVEGDDADGDTLTYTKSTEPKNGTVTVNSGGSWTYTPKANYNGTDSFTVTVSDGKGGTADSTITITVNAVNDAPTAPDYNVTTNEDEPVSGTVVGNDADGDTLTYTKATNPANGTAVVGTDGKWTYTPKADHNGTDSFTVTVSDGNGGADISTITIVVTPINDSPTVPDYEVTTKEDVPVLGTVVGTDKDGDTLTYTKITDPIDGTVTVNLDGTWVYTPNANYNGIDIFDVKVSDGNGGTAISTIIIEVTPVNDLPKVPDYEVTTKEDVPVSGTVVGTDIEGSILTYTKQTDPKNGTVTVKSDGTWVYTPNANYNGSDSFTVVVSDSNGGTAISTITILVTPENDVPTVPDYNVNTKEDEPVSGIVVGTDVDGDTLTYTKQTDPKNGTVDVNSDGTWIYTPNTDYNGTDSFTVEVSDGKGGTDISTVNILVGGDNDLPTVPDYKVTTKEDEPVSGTVIGTDADGDTLTYQKQTDPTNGIVTVNSDGTWKYVPKADYNGTDSFTVTVSDGNGGTAISTITVIVAPVNDIPTVPDYNVTTKEDEPVSGIVVGTDKDGDTLIYTKQTDPVNGTAVVNSDGTWVYTPNAYYNGTDSFTVEVNDGNLGTAISIITVVVTPENDAPTVPDYNVTTIEDVPVSGTVVGTDIDGDKLIYTKQTEPKNGTVTVNSDGTWTYTPNTDYNGTDSFTVEVSDGKGGTVVSTVTIVITPANDPPTVPNYNLTTKQGVEVSGKVVGKDIDGDTLKYTKATDPKNGTAVIEKEGNYTYTPKAGFTGTDSFTVEVADGQGGKAISTITITVESGAIITTNNPPPYIPPVVTTPTPTPTPAPVAEEKPKEVPAAVIVKSDLAITIESMTMRAEQNSIVKYTIKYYNKKDNDVGGTCIKVNVPDKMLFEEADNNGKLMGDEIIWSLGVLKGSGKGEVSFKLKVKPLSELQTTVLLTSKIYSEDKTVELINIEDDESKISTMLFTNVEDHKHTRYILGYPDGNVKPKGLITRAEVAVIFARILDLKKTVKGKKIYDDVDLSFWAAGHIEAVSEIGLFKGYKDNTFRPNAPITRAELATVIAHYLKLEKGSGYEVLEHHFTDLLGHWAEKSIEEIFRYDIIKGYEDGTFRPNNTVTREETVKMINQMLYRGPLKGAKPSFPDNLETSWSFGHIEEATKSHTSTYNSDGSETLLKFIQEGIW